jgi:hypothetical protein
MTRRNALWALLVGVPVAAGGTFAVVQAAGATAIPTGACCTPAGCPPGCCEAAVTVTPPQPTDDCCPPGCCATAKTETADNR